jgi:hypothetical protein
MFYTMLLPTLLLWIAQTPDPPPKAGAASLARIGGVVLSNANSQPLRRARVTLAPRIAGLGGSTVETSDSGEFSFENIEPGQYGLQVTRDGYLPGYSARSGPFRLPRVMNLQPGESLKDVTFRLEPWAIVDGKVRFDDAEPALNVPVYLYQKVYFRGRQIYRVAAQTRTDDRGYYRMHGIGPGTYSLAAVYNKPVEKPKENEPLKAPDREPSYASVYYPSGTRITDALPIRLTSGQELTGLDMFLERTETVRVSGDLTDGCTGQFAPGATLEVVRTDDGGATIATNAEIRQFGGKFVIRGLGPGSYLLQATLAPVSGRPGCPERTEIYPLTVGAEPVDNVSVMLANDMPTRFFVVTDDKLKTFNASGFPVKLEPRTPGRPIVTIARVDRRPEYTASLNARQTYDIFIDRFPEEDMYQLPPYSIEPGGSHTIRIGTQGGRAAGTVYDSVTKKPLPGAVVTFIPESYQPQLFREGYVDTNGIFTARGLAPGSYIAVPWLDVPPCQVNVPAEVESCRAKGKTFTAKAGEQAVLELEVAQ